MGNFGDNWDSVVWGTSGKVLAHLRLKLWWTGRARSEGNEVGLSLFNLDSTVLAGAPAGAVGARSASHEATKPSK